MSRISSRCMSADPPPLRQQGKAMCTAGPGSESSRPGADPGYNGAPGEATAEIGERMLALKVGAALAQIERLSAGAM